MKKSKNASAVKKSNPDPPVKQIVRRNDAECSPAVQVDRRSFLGGVTAVAIAAGFLGLPAAAEAAEIGPREQLSQKMGFRLLTQPTVTRSAIPIRSETTPKDCHMMRWAR
jgi:hypothetical protein